MVSKNGKYAVKTIASGKTHGFTTKEKAQAQMRLLESIMRKKL